MKAKVHDIHHPFARTKSSVKVRVGPAGLHFFNRATGVNVLVDEIKPRPEFWSAAPRQVSIALTNICDLSCPHCYAPKDNCVLSFIQVIDWLKELDENDCIGIGFGGGEPTLYPRFVDLCSYAARETNLAVTMTTHGHHLSDDLINDLTGNVHFVRVSMDGVGTTYESIRRRSFDLLLQRIKMLSTITPFGINFVINSKTIYDLNTGVEIAEKLGAVEFLLLPEVPAGRARGIDEDTTRALRQWVSEYHGNIPLSVSESGADGLPVCNPLKAEKGLSAFAHIDASGVLKRTSYDITGVKIQANGVIAALHQLKTKKEG